MKKVYYILGLIASFKLGLAIGDIKIKELEDELKKAKEKKKDLVNQLKEIIARCKAEIESI